VLEVEVLNGLGNVRRFQRVEVHRLAFVDRAESAMPCTSIAPKHECRRLIGPAFKDVWALCFLADGMETEAADQIEDSILVPRVAEFDLQPFWLSLALTVLTIQKSVDYNLFFDHFSAQPALNTANDRFYRNRAESATIRALRLIVACQAYASVGRDLGDPLEYRDTRLVRVICQDNVTHIDIGPGVNQNRIAAV
jgi:hypothetical protein